MIQYDVQYHMMRRDKIQDAVCSICMKCLWVGRTLILGFEGPILCKVHSTTSNKLTSLTMYLYLCIGTLFLALFLISTISGHKVHIRCFHTGTDYCLKNPKWLIWQSGFFHETRSSSGNGEWVAARCRIKARPWDIIVTLNRVRHDTLGLQNMSEDGHEFFMRRDPGALLLPKHAALSTHTLSPR